MTTPQPQEYIIDENIANKICFALVNCGENRLANKLCSRPAPSAPSQDRIGSIRQNIYQEDAYLIERVNAGMGEWEYVIQYCGEYYATTPTEEIALNIVEMAQHTCPCFTPQHDAIIRNQALDELKTQIELTYSKKGVINVCDILNWIESLRSSEAQQ